MRLVQPSLPSYVCRTCAEMMRRPGHRPILPRLSSSLASSRPVNFSWFFFHNDRWTRNPSFRRSQSKEGALLPAGPAALDALQYPPTPSAVAYRASEVLTPRRLLKIYAQLSKSNLTILVVLTAMSGVALSPLPTTVPVLLSTAIGTALCSASANTLNQLQEVPFDAQMARTRTRPLVRRAITPLHASGFALVTGIMGPTLLWTMTNPTTACIGLANIALYAGAYTWLKRRSVLNTWVGAVVGGLPPLMGWTACGGTLLPTSSFPLEAYLPAFLSSVPLADNPLAPLALFMLLFSWQFPHFNALSHFLRESYAQAGYHMLSVLSPSKNALVSLRHSILLSAICSILVPFSGLTTWTFSLLSLVPNIILTEASWRFWREGSEKQARRLFRHSLWYLPVILGLMMFCKRGLDWTSFMGKRADDKGEVSPSTL